MPNLSSFKTREEFNNWYSNYRNSKKWKKYHADYNRKWREKNSIEKDLARVKVSHAIKSGKLKRGFCEICDDFVVEAHHDDYSKPLEVRWFCRLHHRKHDVSTGKRED